MDLISIFRNLYSAGTCIFKFTRSKMHHLGIVKIDVFYQSNITSRMSAADQKISCPLIVSALSRTAHAGKVAPDNMRTVSLIVSAMNKNSGCTMRPNLCTGPLLCEFIKRRRRSYINPLSKSDKIKYVNRDMVTKIAAKLTF
jgi:hypothetical protein